MTTKITHNQLKKPHTGFTIVELLIVIVVIGILAAITIVAYNGIQQRSRDSERQYDVAAIQKVLELYYIDNNTFPYSDHMQDPAWRRANLAVQDQGIFINPLEPNSSNSISASGGSVTVNKYSYYSVINSSGTTCMSTLANGPCTGYRMAWRLEANPATVTAKNVQK